LSYRDFAAFDERVAILTELGSPSCELVLECSTTYVTATLKRLLQKAKSSLYSGLQPPSNFFGRQSQSNHLSRLCAHLTYEFD
jgi:hypothetical protein